MADLQGGELLAEITKAGPVWDRLGLLLRTKIIPAINATARNAGVAPVGNAQAPTPPNAVTVKHVGEMVHVSITDNNKLQKGVHYFTEADTSPAFPQPIVIHHGPSRTGAPFSLPTNDDLGVAHTWYLRSYAQYPGSAPSSSVVYGGQANPLGITLSGSTSMTLLPSTGSGTAPGNGQTGGVGFGKAIQRTVPQPKRLVSS